MHLARILNICSKYSLLHLSVLGLVIGCNDTLFSSRTPQSSAGPGKGVSNSEPPPSEDLNKAPDPTTPGINAAQQPGPNAANGTDGGNRSQSPATGGNSSNGSGTLGGIFDVLNNLSKVIPVPGTLVDRSDVPSGFQPCSKVYLVPGTANPYMAGVANGTSTTYDLSKGGGGPDPVDRAPATSPVLITPIDGNCIAAGKILAFTVWGAITFSAGSSPVSANGHLDMIMPHQKEALFGKSNIIAPMSSLLGVFLGPDDPTSHPAPPTLDYTSRQARDYDKIMPQVGQIFFIGDGKNSSGNLHKVVVPQGATRLYFAVFDIYQWNNNGGSLSGAVLVQK